MICLSGSYSVKYMVNQNAGKSANPDGCKTLGRPTRDAPFPASLNCKRTRDDTANCMLCLRYAIYLETLELWHAFGGMEVEP